MFHSARLIFSEDSHAMNALRALYNVAICTARFGDWLKHSKADRLSFIIDGNMQFSPKPISADENPLLLIKVFLALTAQANAVSMSHLMSSFIFKNVLVSV